MKNYNYLNEKQKNYILLLCKEEIYNIKKEILLNEKLNLKIRLNKNTIEMNEEKFKILNSIISNYQVEY